MDTKVNYALVGGFVLVLITFIVLSIIWLSSGFSNAQKYSIYQVNMQEAVTGLSVDAIVEYNGVNVGNVESITIDKNNPQSVVLLLNVHEGTPITQGTIATLGTRGLTGITYIALKDHGTDLRALRAAKDQKYPLIKTGPSFLLQVDTGIKKITESISEFSNSFQKLFDKQNLKSIKEILISMQAITANIAANNQQLNTILENTTLLSQKFPAIIANLDNITDNLTGLSAELRENPAILLRGTTARTLGPGETK